MINKPYVGVVDDDDAIRHSIHILLELHGLHVAEFESAKAALCSPMRSQCFCLLVAMEMPEASGLQLVETMRSAADQTPIILMTERPHAADLARIRASKALALLVKPIQQDELLAWIRHTQGINGDIGDFT